MNDQFIKKKWEEEDVLFYVHFHNGIAIKQLEISSLEIIHLTTSCPVVGESFLYDQKLDDLILQDSDYISKEEFNRMWLSSFNNKK